MLGQISFGELGQNYSGGNIGAASSRSPPYSTCRLAQHEQISRSRQSSTVVPAPYRAAISAGSGSTW